MNQENLYSGKPILRKSKLKQNKPMSIPQKLVPKYSRPQKQFVVLSENTNKA